MYKRGDKEFIIDMFLACRKILEYTGGFTLEDFRKDTKTYDAVVRNLEILGEAVKNISKDFREKYPEVEWKDIAKTRDKMIHYYFGLSIMVIWDIITQDIPLLHSRLKKSLMKIIGTMNWNHNKILIEPFVPKCSLWFLTLIISPQSNWSITTHNLKLKTHNS